MALLAWPTVAIRHPDNCDGSDTVLHWQQLTHPSDRSCRLTGYCPIAFTSAKAQLLSMPPFSPRSTLFRPVSLLAGFLPQSTLYQFGPPLVLLLFPRTAALPRFAPLHHPVQF